MVTGGATSNGERGVKTGNETLRDGGANVGQGWPGEAKRFAEILGFMDQDRSVLPNVGSLGYVCGVTPARDPRSHADASSDRFCRRAPARHRRAPGGQGYP